MMRKREFDMKKKAINTAKHRFTLVELLVSMGVLVVILGFILQFFIGSQRLWQSAASDGINGARGKLRVRVVSV